jgi:hypothetical protein
VRRLLVVVALAGCGGTLPGQHEKSSPPPGPSPSAVAAANAANGTPAGNPCPVTPVAPGTAKIEGSTFNVSKTAIAGVTVIVTTAGAGQQHAISDETGHFHFDALPAGYYDVTAYYADLTVSRGCVVAGGGSTVAADLMIPTTE